MKIAISVRDEVYAEADRLARRLQRPRSQLYTDALREYLARHDPEAVTEAVDRVCERVETTADPAVAAAGAALLRRVEW